MNSNVPLPTGDNSTEAASIPAAPQMVLLDFFFPGFSVFSNAVQKYLHIDLNLYIPLVLLIGAFTFIWRYFSDYFGNLAESHLMSVVDIRTDDEIYNMLMGWVASQRFAKSARRFVVNTNLNSRSWFLWRWDDDDEQEEYGDDSEPVPSSEKKKALAYTPTFGSHWFWYKGRLLIFRRSQNQNQASFMAVSQSEEISISCFGRNPWILKELLHEARQAYMKRDEAKTLIYRGTTKTASADPSWQRCMARTSRPFSTVILNEKVKKDLIDDVTDYLNPATRRWYSNRGIPYRRGYLLHGPPGTGKSSLSLALAGFFKMRIYIVSLSSVSASEENLASLFAELPRRCVVLLEDIDTAGLTHTRDDAKDAAEEETAEDTPPPPPGRRSRKGPGSTPVVAPSQPIGRLSLSGLLNILDGVASQEGRVLIMTTNHIEKLDKALIRPGRVDMIVKFDRADVEMTASIFRAIFAPLEGDDVPVIRLTGAKPVRFTLEEEKQKADKEAEAKKKKDEIIARVNVLADQFAAKIPAHEFSPAEIQGFLLKNKRNPEGAVEGAEQWVIDTRKEKKEKELKDAQDKRDAEEKAKKEAEEKKKEEEEEKAKEEAEKKKSEKKDKKAKRKAAKKSSKSRKSSSKSGSEPESSSDDEFDDDSAKSESDAEKTKKKKKDKKSKATATTATPASTDTPTAALVDDKTAAASTPTTTPEVVVVEPPTAAKPKVEVDVPTVKVDLVETKGDVGSPGVKTPSADSGYGSP
ncbi:BCS1 N terminal-domain-containing protein [Podospora didyma]|uniref:BCS1 N terminal-domain-containing protein n=1 Tax=Podospora didyma TaxID=330526 RepID=A0AAE0NH71_9PEZI|nr:BCS1 N terminal-domain-containing protein [Podospora didyma]